jgi:hypothetical protein
LWLVALRLPVLVLMLLLLVLRPLLLLLLCLPRSALAALSPPWPLAALIT